MSYTWEPETGRFRDDETGRFASPNDVIRKGDVTKDDHGYRLSGQFIPKDALQQKTPAHAPHENQPEAERLVLVDSSGDLTLIRAGGSPTSTDTAEEVLASGIASAALKEGIVTPGEYEDLGRQQTADLVRDMAVLRQDLTTF